MNLRSLPFLVALAVGCSADEAGPYQAGPYELTPHEAENEPARPAFSAQVPLDVQVPDGLDDGADQGNQGTATPVPSPDDFSLAALIERGNTRSLRLMDADGVVVHEMDVHRDVGSLSWHPDGKFLLQSQAYGFVWMELDGTWQIMGHNAFARANISNDGEVIIADEFTSSSYDGDFQLLAATPFDSQYCFTDAVHGGEDTYLIDMFGTSVFRWDRQTIELELVAQAPETATVLGRDQFTESLWFGGFDDHIWMKDLAHDEPAQPVLSLQRIGNDVRRVHALEPAGSYVVYAALQRSADEIVRIDGINQTIDSIMVVGPGESLLDLVAF